MQELLYSGGKAEEKCTSVTLYKAQTVRDTAEAQGSVQLSRAHVLGYGILHMWELWHMLITSQALGYIHGKECTTV